MSELLARLNVSEEQGVIVAEFTETKMLDEVKIAEIGQALKDLAAKKERPKMVLDFSNVDFFSSAALGMLVDVSNYIKQRNGLLRLSNVKPPIMKVFALTKLERVLKISNTREGAIQLLNRNLESGTLGHKGE